MIHICYLLVVLLLLLADSRAQTYKRIKDYDTYLSLWQQKKQNVIIHDVSNLGPIKDQCNSNKCKFFYYEYKQKQERPAPYNRTVLMVSGMHGNEFIGPHVLLYGYQHFKGAHIIYFPIVNPSGFQRQDRYTYPQKVDPNRDFPIDNNIACYQTYSTIVLDYIFRKYQIDVTFILHNGGSEIGFNWGTLYHQANSHTEEYQMQLSIAEMMKRVGGSNQALGIQQFKVGTMTQVIYPVTGTFDDWAFAASRYPSIITKCQNHEYQPYPSNMMNGLVFLIELGTKKKDLFGSLQAVKFGPRSRGDGYVSRGIRLLKAGLQIVNPSLSLKIKQNKVSLVVRGCSSAQVDQLDIIQHISQTENTLYFRLKSPVQVEGTVRKENPKPYIISFQNELQNGTTKISYKGSFTCSKEWLGKGTTFFATNRKYDFNQLIDLTALQSEELQNIDEYVELKWYEQPQVQKYALYLIILLGVLVLMSAIFAVLRCICAVKTVQKEEKTQFQEDQMDTGQDLHTARGGIINQSM